MKDLIVQIDTEKKTVCFIHSQGKVSEEFEINGFLTGQNSVCQTVLNGEKTLKLIKFLVENI